MEGLTNVGNPYHKKLSSQFEAYFLSSRKSKVNPDYYGLWFWEILQKIKRFWKIVIVLVKFRLTNSKSAHFIFASFFFHRFSIICHHVSVWKLFFRHIFPEVQARAFPRPDNEVSPFFLFFLFRPLFLPFPPSLSWFAHCSWSVHPSGGFLWVSFRFVRIQFEHHNPGRRWCFRLPER